MNSTWPNEDESRRAIACQPRDERDELAIREMERRLSKQSAWREWRLWLIVLGIIVVLPFAAWFLFALFFAHQLASHGG